MKLLFTITAIFYFGPSLQIDNEALYQKTIFLALKDELKGRKIQVVRGDRKIFDKEFQGFNDCYYLGYIIGKESVKQGESLKILIAVAEKGEDLTNAKVHIIEFDYNTLKNNSVISFSVQSLLSDSFETIDYIPKIEITKNRKRIREKIYFPESILN